MSSINPVINYENYSSSIQDNEEQKNSKAMLQLMSELNQGKISGEEEGYVSSEDVRTYFHNKNI